MIGPIVYLTDPSWTGTEKPAPLGTLRAHVDVTHGYQLYRWVKATALIPANVAVQYADAVDGTGAKSAEQIPAKLRLGLLSRKLYRYNRRGCRCW